MTNHAPGYGPSPSGRDPLVPSGSDGVSVEPATPIAPGELLPMTLNELRQWHMDELAALCPDRPQDHGWSPFSRRLFLDTLAETGKVGEACEMTGLARAGAYALRNRDRLFAAGWDAAAAIARDVLADRLAEAALDGVTDTLTRADGVTITRHRFDTRLSIAVLHRLDKRCDRAAADLPAAYGPRAAWDEYLVAVGSGDVVAAAAIAFAPPPSPPAPTGDADSAPHCPACPKPAADGDSHPSLADQLALMKGIRDGSIDAREEALALAESDDDDLSDRVWTNVDGCFTNFPPPPGFTGFQQDKWGDEEYYRVLTPDEMTHYEAVLADWAAEDAAEVAGRMADDEARRRDFFDIEEKEEEAAPDDGPPAEEPTSEPLLLTDTTEPSPPPPAEPTSEDQPSKNAPTSEDRPSENAPTSEDQPSENAATTEPSPQPPAGATTEPSPQPPTPDEEVDP
ncbi:hypothetical protein [Sphingomonas sp. RB1R13]|uniref:hypothetical protein n=1 Tax=Sphingomonas sp. RB1R13 TaxID=3096159 RepID=UPI002FCC385A